MRRIATILPTLVFVSMLIFGLQTLLPGDPAVVLAGEEQDPAVIAYLREKMRLDEPLPIRYLYWVGDVLRGDLGESIRSQQPVLELILQKLPVTIELALLAMLIAVAIGVPAGVISAVKQGSLWDHAANVIGLAGLSHAELLARHPDDPVLLGLAGLAAGVGLRRALGRPDRQPAGDGDAGLRPGHRHCGCADAPHAQCDAAGDERRLCAHRKGEGTHATGRDPAPRAAQCADAGDHAGRAGIGHLAERRGA